MIKIWFCSWWEKHKESPRLIVHSSLSSVLTTLGGHGRGNVKKGHSVVLWQTSLLWNPRHLYYEDGYNSNPYKYWSPFIKVKWSIDIKLLPPWVGNTEKGKIFGCSTWSGKRTQRDPSTLRADKYGWYGYGFGVL